MNNLPNGLDTVIRVTAKDLTSKDITPLTSQSGISEVAKTSLKDLEKAPGLHVTMADKTVVFDLSDVKKAAFLHSFEKDKFDAFVLKPENPIIAEKIRFLLEMNRTSIFSDLLNADLMNDQYEPIRSFDDIRSEIAKHGGSIVSYLDYLKRNETYAAAVEKILKETLGKYENLSLTTEDLKRLSTFLQTSEGIGLFLAVQRQMTPEIINKYFQENILNPIRQKIAKGVDTGKVKEAEKKADMVDMSFKPSEEARVMPLFSEIKDIGIKTKLISICRNLREYEENYNEDLPKEKRDETPEEHFEHLHTAVEDYISLPSSARKGVGKLLSTQGIGEKTIKDFCSQVLNPDAFYREIGLPKPEKDLTFWEELSYDSDAILVDYASEKNKEYGFKEPLPANMSEAAKATGMKVVEATSWFRAFINRVKRFLGFSIEEPRLTLKHKGIPLKFDPKVVAESAFKHHFAKTPLLRNTDGTIKVAISDEFIAKKMDSSKISQTLISRKRDTLRDMLHDLVQTKTAITLAIDKAAHAIAEWQFYEIRRIYHPSKIFTADFTEVQYIEKHPVHPVTGEPLTMAQLEAIARQEIEKVMPDPAEIEKQYMKDPSGLRGNVLSYIKTQLGERYPSPISLFVSSELDPNKRKMFEQADIVGMVNEFLDVGDSFNVRWRHVLGDSAKVYNKKFQEVFAQELEKYDDLIPGSKEYNALIKFVTDNPKYLSFEKATGFIGSGERVLRGEGVQEFIAKRVDAFVNGTIKVKFAEDSEDMVHAGLLSIMTGEVALDKDNVVKWPGTPEFEALKKRDARAAKIRADGRKLQRPKISEEMQTFIKGLTIKGDKVDVAHGVEIGAFVGPKPLVTSKIAGKEYPDLSLTEFQNRFMGPRGEYTRRLQDFIDRGVYGTSPTGFTEVEDVRQLTENTTQQLLDELHKRQKRSPEELVELKKEAVFLSKYANDCLVYLQNKVSGASVNELKLIQKQIEALKLQSNLLKETDGKWVASIHQLHNHFSDTKFANSYMQYSRNILDDIDDWMGRQLGRSSTKDSDAARMNAIIDSRATRGFYDFNVTRDLEKYLDKRLKELNPVKEAKQVAHITQERDKLRKVISDREFAKAFVSSMKGTGSFQEALPMWRKRLENSWTYLTSEKKPEGHGWEEISNPKRIQKAMSLIKEYSTKELLEARDPATEDIRNMIPVIPQITIDRKTKDIRLVTSDDYKEKMKLNVITNPAVHLKQIDEMVSYLENPRIDLRTPEAIDSHLEKAIAFYTLVNRGVDKEDIDQENLSTLALRLEHIILTTANLAKAKAPEFAVEKRNANEARNFANIFHTSFTADIPIWKQFIGNNWRYQASKSSPGSGWDQMDSMDAIIHLSNLARVYVTPEKVEEDNPVTGAIVDAANAISRIVKNNQGKLAIIEPKKIMQLPDAQKPEIDEDVLPHELLGEVDESLENLENLDIQTMEQASIVLKNALAFYTFLKNPDANADNTDVERLIDRLEILMNSVSMKLPFLREREGQFDKEFQSLNTSKESPQILFDRTKNTLVTTTKEKSQGSQVVEVGDVAKQILQHAQTLNKQIQNHKAEERARELKQVRNTVSQLSSAITKNLPVWKQFKDGHWVYQGGLTSPKGPGWQHMPLLDIMATLADLSQKYVTTEKIEANEPTAKAIQEVIKSIAYVVKSRSGAVSLLNKKLEDLPPAERSNFDKNVKPSENFFAVDNRISDLEITPINTLKDAEDVMKQAIAYYAYLKTPDERVIKKNRQDLLQRLEVIMKSISRIVPILNGHAVKQQSDAAINESRELTIANELRELAKSEDTPRLYLDPSDNRIVMASPRYAKAKGFSNVADELVRKSHEMNVYLVHSGLFELEKSQIFAEYKRLIDSIEIAVNMPQQKIPELFAQLQLLTNVLNLKLQLQFAPETILAFRQKMNEIKKEIQEQLDKNQTLTQNLANQISSGGSMSTILNTFVDLPQKNRISLGAMLVKNNTSKANAKAFNDAVLKIKRDHPEILKSITLRIPDPVEREIKEKQLLIELESARALIATAIATEEQTKENVSTADNLPQLQTKIREAHAKIDQANTPDQLRAIMTQFPEVSKTSAVLMAKLRAEMEYLDKELTLIENANKELAATQALQSTNSTEASQIQKANDILKDQHKEIQSAIANAILEMKEVLKGDIRKAILRTNDSMRQKASEGLARDIALTNMSEISSVEKDVLDSNLLIRSQILSGTADAATEKLYIEDILPWFEEHNINPNIFDGMVSELTNNPKKVEEHPEFIRRLDNQIVEAGEEVPVPYLSDDQRKELASERLKVRRDDPILGSRSTLQGILQVWKADPNALELRFISAKGEVSPVNRNQGKRTSRTIDIQQYRTFITQRPNESDFAVNQAAYGFVKAQLTKKQSPEDEAFLRNEEIRLGKALLEVSPDIMARIQPMLIPGAITGSTIAEPPKTLEQNFDFTREQLTSLKTKMFESFFAPLSDSRDELYAQYRLGKELLKIIDEQERNNMVLGNVATQERIAIQTQMNLLKTTIFNMMNESESVVEEIITSLKTSAPLAGAVEAFVELPKDSRKSLAIKLMQNAVSVTSIKDFAHAIRSIKRDSPLLKNSSHITATDSQEREIQINNLFIELEFAAADLVRTATEAEEQQTQVQKIVEKINYNIDQAQTPQAIREIISQYPEVVKLLNKESANVEKEIQQLKRENDLIEKYVEDLAKMQMVKPQEAIRNEINLLKAQAKDIASSIENVITELKEVLKVELRRAVMRRNENIRKDIRQGLAMDLALLTTATAAGVTPQELKDTLEILRLVKSGKASKEIAQQYVLETDKWFKDHKIDPDNIDRMINGLVKNPLKIDQHPEFFRRLEDFITKSIGREMPPSKMAERANLASEREKIRFHQLQAIPHAAIDAINSKIDQAKSAQEVQDAIKSLPLAVYKMEPHQTLFQKEMQQLDLETSLHSKTMEDLGKKYIELKGGKEAEEFEKQIDRIKSDISLSDIMQDMNNAILELKAAAKEAVRQAIMSTRVDSRQVQRDQFVDRNKRLDRMSAREKIRISSPIFNREYTLNKVLNDWETNPISLQARMFNDEVAFVGKNQIADYGSPSSITLEQFRKYRERAPKEVMVLSSPYKYQKEMMGKDMTQMGINAALYGFVRSELNKPHSEADLKYLKAQEELLANLILNPSAQIEVPKPIKIPVAKGAAVEVPKKDVGLKQKLAQLSFGEGLTQVNSFLNEILSIEVGIPKEIDEKAKTFSMPSPKVSTMTTRPQETLTKKAAEKSSAQIVIEQPKVDPRIQLYEQILRRAQFISSTIRNATKLPLTHIYENNERIAEILNATNEEHESISALRKQIHSSLTAAQSKLDELTIKHFEKITNSTLVDDIWNSSKIGYNPNSSESFFDTYRAISLTCFILAERLRSSSTPRLKEQELNNLTASLKAIEENIAALDSIVPMTTSEKTDLDKATALLKEVESNINKAIKSN